MEKILVSRFSDFFLKNLTQMCKIFTFVPTNSLLIENHHYSLVPQSGEEVWSNKQVLEILLMMY